MNAAVPSPIPAAKPSPRPAPEAALSVIIVTFDSADALQRSLPAITRELREDDELIVCDNGSTDGTPQRVTELAPEARLIELGGNPGFGVACNAGAEAAANPLLLFLNPDAVVAPGFRDAIVLPLREGRDWGAWQGLLTSAGGAEVNTWGGVVHFTGISWAGGAGAPIASAPATPREVAFASGGCLLTTRAVWSSLGGFSPEYFLYHEDTDLGLRMWRAGQRVGLEPRARAEHEYEFDKGSPKWFRLEANRWATIVRTYPARLLGLLAPALLATEIALHAVALAGGWLPEKLRADRAVLRALPRLLDERRLIGRGAPTSSDPGAGVEGEHAPVPGIGTAAGTAISPRAFAELLTPDLGSAFLGRAGRLAPLRLALRAYWRLVLLLLGRR